MTGIVTAIGTTEIQVDVGCKQAGYIPVSELSSDPDVKPEDVVHVGDQIVHPHPDVLRHVRAQSGEGRFRWLHAKPGAAADLLAAASEHHSGTAWVHSRTELIERGWFGPVVSPPVAARYGDVALVPYAPISFHDPDDSGPFPLVCRHGSLTSAEMLVPLLAAVAK